MRTSNESRGRSEFERRVLADLAVLKNQMSVLLGNGQPGRLRNLEARTERHESALQNLRGVGLVMGALLAIAQLTLLWLRLYR